MVIINMNLLHKTVSIFTSLLSEKTWNTSSIVNEFITKV